MKINILGVKVDNLNFRESLTKVEDFLKDKKKHYVVTPNPEIIVAAQENKKLKQILNKADLAIPDGIGLKIASAILGNKELRERVAGVDLADKLCELAAKKGFRVGFLGGGPGVAEEAAKCQKERYQGLKVVFAKGSDPEEAARELNKEIKGKRDKGKKDKGIREKESLVTQPLNSKLPLDLLFVAYGAPRQEYWMARNIEKISAKVAIGVGGALDYFAGKKIRAPKIVQNLGLEWLWRLILEPWRIKRQLSLLIFIFLVFKEKLKKLRRD